MKRILIATLITLLTAGAALANGGGGGRGHGGPGGDEGFGGIGGGNTIVAADGTLFITRRVVDTATDTSTTQLVAITPSGSAAWTITLTDGGRFVLSGSNLLSVSNASTDTAVTSTDAAVTSTVTARSTSTGATAWTATLSGRVTDLEPFSGGTYAIVVVPAATEGGSATRSVVAISNSGATLWTASI